LFSKNKQVKLQPVPAEPITVFVSSGSVAFLRESDYPAAPVLSLSQSDQLRWARFLIWKGWSDRKRIAFYPFLRIIRHWSMQNRVADIWGGSVSPLYALVRVSCTGPADACQMESGNLLPW